MQKPLTIATACFDDFDGVWFTLKSLLLYHPEVSRRCELLVVDNNPGSAHGVEVERFASKLPSARYVPFDEATGTAQSRNQVFALAQTPFVLCLDCHVLLESGSIDRLLRYIERDAESNDLLQGPLIGDRGDVLATHQSLHWRSQALGTWEIDQRGVSRDAEPFEIAQQGMGCFAMRREAWPKFHSDFRGFGGCETYVAEQVRAAGGRVLCIPFLRWHHRFPRPGGVPYVPRLEDRLRNYWITAKSLNWDIELMFDQFCEGLEREQVTRLREVWRQLEARGAMEVWERMRPVPSSQERRPVESGGAVFPYESYDEYLTVQREYSLQRRQITESRRGVTSRAATWLREQFPTLRSVICLGARHSSEVEAFHDAGFAAEGIDLHAAPHITACDMSRLAQHPHFFNRQFDIAFASHSLEHCLDFAGLYRSLRSLRVKVIYAECPILQKPDRRECRYYPFMTLDNPQFYFPQYFPDYTLHTCYSKGQRLVFVLRDNSLNSLND